VAAAAAAGCGGGGDGDGAPQRPAAQRAPSTTTPAPPARPLVLATGLTEANPQLLFEPASHPDLAPGFAQWRDLALALRPRYIRVPVYWSQLQPDPSQPARLDMPADGCLRGTPPCGVSNGLRDQLAAIASEQRAPGLDGGPEVEVVIAGVPAWAATGPSGCERSDAGPASRPINAAGLAGYRALITQFAALAQAEGARVRYWSPWNEPNHPAFISPQRAACSPASPSLAPAVYTQLVRAAHEALDAAPGAQELVLGELAGTTTPSPRRSTVQEMIAALPDDVVCLSRTWSQHDYAQVVPDPGKPDPVVALEQALDARPCTRGAHIWVTETGVGGPTPGGERPTGDLALRQQCRAQSRVLRRWADDPRVDVAFQYTFREDTAYPVGLVDPALTRAYPTYDLWRAWGGTRDPTAPPPPLPASCA